jgi:hypothetical protein
MKHLFWADGSARKIGRANIDGTEPNGSFISELSDEPRDVASDGTYVYWTNHGGAIGRAKVDGTEIKGEWLTEAQVGKKPFGIALTPTHIYWTREGGDLGRANIDGTEPNSSFIAASTSSSLCVDETFVYWADYNNNKIGRAKLDGTEIESEWLTANRVIGLQVDLDFIYFCQSEAHKIGRANIDGTEPNANFITAPTAFGMGIDEEFLYLGLGTNIGRVSKAGGAVSEKWLETPTNAWGVQVESEPEPEPEPEPEGDWDILAQGFNNTGDWDSGTTYHPYDVVRLRGSSYVCLKGHTGKEPPSTEYWDVLALGGSGGSFFYLLEKSIGLKEPQATKRVVFDNNTPGSITKVYISTTDLDGAPTGTMLRGLTEGRFLYFRNPELPSKVIVLKVMEVTEKSEFVEIAVEFEEESWGAITGESEISLTII